MNLETLEIRRVRFDLIFLYKIFHNMIDIDFGKYFALNTAKKKIWHKGTYVNAKTNKLFWIKFQRQFFHHKNNINLELLTKDRSWIS